MRGGGRVSARQPDMKGDHARLRAKADERQHENRVFDNRLDIYNIFLDHRKIQRPRSRVKKQEGEHDESRSDVGHHEIDRSGFYILFFPVLINNQEIGRKRHDLPGDQEEKGMTGADHQYHPSDKGIVKESQVSDIILFIKMNHIAGGIEGSEQGNQRDHENKKRR